MKRLFQTKLFVFIFAILTGGATISCHEEKIGNDSGIDSPDGNDGSTLPDHGGGSSKPEMGDEITAVDGTKLEELSKWTVTPHTNPGLFVQDEAFPTSSIPTARLTAVIGWLPHRHSKP